MIDIEQEITEIRHAVAKILATESDYGEFSPGDITAARVHALNVAVGRAFAELARGSVDRKSLMVVADICVALASHARIAQRERDEAVERLCGIAGGVK